MIWPLRIWKHVEGPASAIIIRQLTGGNDKTHEDSWLMAEFRSSNLPNMYRQWRSLRHDAEAVTAIQYLRRSLWPLNADEEKQRNKQSQHSNLETPLVMFCNACILYVWDWHIGHQKGRGYLVDLDVHGTTYNEEGEMAVSCENCNEPSSSIKYGTFLVLHDVGWLVSAT